MYNIYIYHKSICTLLDSSFRGIKFKERAPWCQEIIKNKPFSPFQKKKKSLFKSNAIMLTMNKRTLTTVCGTVEGVHCCSLEVIGSNHVSNQEKNWIKERLKVDYKSISCITLPCLNV